MDGERRREGRDWIIWGTRWGMVGLLRLSVRILLCQTETHSF